MFPGPTINVLRERALALQEARSFFWHRGILEVDCCALSSRAAIDPHIDVIEAEVSGTEKGFLHTSPEYAMKQLLAQGSGDIYYLGHVFRKGDIGRIHNPEFTMAEWYRLGIDLFKMIEETASFLSLFFGSLPLRMLSYRQAFLHYAGIDPNASSLSSMRDAARRYFAFNAHDWDKDTCAHFLLTHAVEPHLGINELTVISDFPPEEAALACTKMNNGELVAERFEIYHQGIELANGYHELADPVELRARFLKANQLRLSENKPPYLLDESFLACLGKGFPDCCGVSVGFDRAFMLRQNLKSIHEVLPFSWRAKPEQ